MRNLKRALSLTLASVMLLGMMVIGTSAASFTDADQITNETAATVLQELEVMQGSNGKFNPNGTVTRGQMAILICKMLYGSKLNAENFAGTSEFTDVPANAYYTGYVNLASQLGIISGYGNGKFGPGAPVTTAQAALMLTKALGWFQAGELENQSWTSNAIAAVEKATTVNLFGSLRLANDAPLSRDNVCEMVFNALTKTSPVKYNERWDAYYTDEGSIIGGVKFRYTDTLGYKNFTLVYSDASDKDDFGRPSIVWGIGDGSLGTSDLDTATGNIKEGANVVIKDEIITTSKAASKVYVGEVKAKAIYEDLNMRGDLAAGKVTVCEDNKTETSINGNNAKGIAKDDVNTKFGKDGQTVEVWYTKGATAADDTATVVITSSYLGIVTDASYREGGKDGMRVNVFGMGLKFIEADGYSKNDVLLVNMSGTDLKAIVGTPKTVTGEATQVGVSSDANRSLTIDGKKYKQSIKFTSGDSDVVDGESNANLGIEKTYTLYLDQNDCFLAAVEIEDNSSTDLVYLYRAYNGKAMDGDEVVDKAMVTVVSMDGTYKTVALTKINGNKVTNAASESGTLESNNKGALVELKYDEDDKEYDLVTTVSRYTVKNGTPGGSSAVDLDTDTRYKTLVNGQGDVYLNGSTVYVFVAPDGNKIDNVKVVTGGVDFDIATDAKVAYATGKSNTTAQYVVIQAEYEAGSDDVVYIKSDAKRDIKDGVIYEGYFANSATKTDIKVDESTVASDNGGHAYNVLEPGFYTYSTKTNDNLKVKQAASFTKGVSGAANTAGARTGVIASMEKDDKGYLMTVGDTTFDLKDVVVIDATDKDKASENTYKSNVNDQSLLKSVVDQKVDGFTQYTVTVALYANKDAEVTALVITNIADKARDLSSTTTSQADVQNALKGGATAEMNSTAKLNEATTITEGTLVLTDAGNLNGKTLTVKSGATVEVKNIDASAAGNKIVTEAGSKVVLDGTTKLPEITGGGTVEITTNAGHAGGQGDPDALADLAKVTGTATKGAKSNNATVFTVPANAPRFTANSKSLLCWDGRPTVTLASLLARSDTNGTAIVFVNLNLTDVGGTAGAKVEYSTDGGKTWENWGNAGENVMPQSVTDGESVTLAVANTVTNIRLTDKAS